MRRLIFASLTLFMFFGSLKAQKNSDSITISQIADHYIQAIGGSDALAKVNSIGFLASGSFNGMPMEIQIERTNSGQILSNISMNGQTLQKTAWNGKSGYAIEQGVKSPLPPDIKKELEKNQPVFPELDFANNSHLKLEGTEMIGGEKSYKIQGENVIYYYSMKTGLKTGETISHEINGELMVIPTTYTDYQVLDGVKFPYSFSQTIMGTTVNYKIHSYAINQALDIDFQ